MCSPPRTCGWGRPSAIRPAGAVGDGTRAGRSACCRTSSKGRCTTRTTTVGRPITPQNSTVSYNALATLLCPSDNQKQRPNYPWAPMNYSRQSRRPGRHSHVDRDDRRRPSPARPPTRSRSTAGAWAPAGGVPTATSASSASKASPTAARTRRSSARSCWGRRGRPHASRLPARPMPSGVSIVDPPGMSVAVQLWQTQALALQTVRACQSLPGTTPSEHWLAQRVLLGAGLSVAHRRQSVQPLQHAQQAHVLQPETTRVVSGEEWTASSPPPVTIPAA